MGAQITTKTGTVHSFCISKSDTMLLVTADFALSDGTEFYIKNNGDEAVTLGVKYKNNDAEDDFIDTRIDPGWNSDLVVAVEKNTTAGLDLQWGI